jgi:ketosteroid isomerase-like protein
VDQAEAVVREYVAACNEGYGPRVTEVLHPDVQMHEAQALPGAVSAVGLESVKRYLGRFGTYWRAFFWEPIEFRSAGERVLMPARLHLTGRESGIAVVHEWFYVFTVRDGKLLRQEAFAERAEAEAVFLQT